MTVRTQTDRPGLALMRIDTRLVVGAEIALAALLGFIALGGRSFWLDESVSVTLAQLDWSEFAHQLRVREGNMSLYHLLLSWWIGIDDSEFAVRSLSVIAGVATVPIGYLLGRRLAGERVGLLAGLLLAVNPMLLHYSQEARGYALCLLLVTGSSYLFVRGIEQPTWRVWVAYSAVTALAAYAHDFALLVPAAHAVSLLFVRREAVPSGKLFGAAGLLFVFLGLLFYLLASNDSSGITWASGNAPGRLFTRIHDRPPVAAALLVGGLVIVVLAWIVLRRRLGDRLRSREAWIWGYLGAWAVVPLAIVVVLAIVYRPLFVIRYFIISLPAVVLLASVVVARLPRPRLAAIVASALVAISVAGVARWYTTGETENWRGATDYVVANASRGDGVLFYAPYVRIPFTLYLDKMGAAARAPAPVYPADGWEASPIKFNFFVLVTAGRVSDAAKSFNRVWVVLSHVALYGGADPGYEAVKAGLVSAGLHDAGSTFFKGVEIRRYEKR